MKTNRRITGIIAAVLALSLLLGIGITAYAKDTAGTLTQEEVEKIVNTSTKQEEVTSPFIEISKKAQESVVGVNNYQVSRRSQFSHSFGFFFDQTPEEFEQERRVGTGSGTVISPYGHVLTNFHVIRDASRVTVNVGDRELEAAVLGTDADLDIAVLLVPGLDLPHVTLGDSDGIQVGEYAIVIGNPLGTQFERSVSVGIVSAVSRTMTSSGRDRYGLRTEIENNMIQVDAAISSGNSGGGMFNTLGQLQGIPTMKLVDNASPFSPSNYSIDNIGMCVPINAAKPLIRTVLENYNAQEAEAQAQKVREQEEHQAADAAKPRPKLGVSVRSVNSFLSASQGIVPQGALVMEVFENTPAQAAGIQVGDIIVEADGEVITTNSQLVAKIQEKNNGDELVLKVYRMTGLMAALEDLSKLQSLGKGEYIDITAQMIIQDGADM
ncbi:MAG: PDZ domain-containing protein [Clostridiales bacterium]|nr:PDZ domain-containing protein [Clostridiales bacterium]